MYRKPSRIFIYLSLIMVVLLVVGLILVGFLISNPSNRFSDDLTADSHCECNLTTEFHAFQTETAIAAQTPIP